MNQRNEGPTSGSVIDKKRKRFLLPFLRKVNSLDYPVDAHHFQPESFHSLDIATPDLTLCFNLDRHDDWHTLLISLLNHVAALGHFERLCLSIRCNHEESDYAPFAFGDVATVAEALTGAIRANPKLSCLDLSGSQSHLHWGPHLQSVFEAMEEHEGLRIFVVQSYPHGDDSDGDGSQNSEDDFVSRFKFDRSWLESLLSRNRNIVVLDGSYTKCTDGLTINKVYALNEFFNGSACLGNESMSLRPSLVAGCFDRERFGKLRIHGTVVIATVGRLTPTAINSRSELGRNR